MSKARLVNEGSGIWLHGIIVNVCTLSWCLPYLLACRESPVVLWRFENVHVQCACFMHEDSTSRSNYVR